MALIPPFLHSARFSPLQSVGIAVGLSAIATAFNVWLDAYMSIAALTMLYLIAVVVAAATLPRWAGLLATVCCVSALNYFFLPPRHTFHVEDAEYLLVLGILLGLSLTLSGLVGRLRQRGVLAETRSLYIAQLLDLSEHLADCHYGADGMAQTAAQWMSDNLALPCAVFVDLKGHPANANPENSAAPSPWASYTSLTCFGASDSLGDTTPFHPRSADWALENRRPLGRGCTDWPDLALWCAPFARHAPTGAVQLLLSSHPWPTPVPDNITQAHWLALVRQIGLCVERERAAALARVAQTFAQSENMRNALLSSLAHDLRTPLAGILGSASTLREQQTSLIPAQRDSLLRNLEDLARDMTLMTDNTLQWARLSPQNPLTLQWESLEEILGEAVIRARRRWQTPLIELHVERDLPPVQAEALLLLQVIANLLDNAARYGQPARGSILLQAGRSREGVFIAVRDFGPGLPPGDPAALFGRFFQGQTPSSDRSTEHHGTGLGLSICQTIVQAHSGRIVARRCSAETGGGAEFYIELPLRSPDVVPFIDSLSY